MSDKLYLLIDRIDVQGANALSSPLTYGFPAITGFLGCVHALNRALSENFAIQFDGALIASHNYNLQAYRPNGYTDYTFNQSRNPIKRDGKTAAIVEEGKIHLTVSLVIEISAEKSVLRDIHNNTTPLLGAVEEKLMLQRLCGGSIRGMGAIELLTSTTDLKYKLLPAFILNDASQQLQEITTQLQKQSADATHLDALIETCTLHHSPPEDMAGAAEKRTEWRTTSGKTGKGWLVPIPIGYQAIASQIAQGALQNSRSPEYPSQYVETLYSLGKWEFPTRIEDFSKCFWRYTNTENELFLVSQTQSIS